MAESSYPFATNSAGGGSQLVSQAQWQAMAHLWASDRIDFTMVNSSYTTSALPFWCELSGSNVIVHAGSAWVGGFYYTLNSNFTVPIPANPNPTSRIDLIVIRADMASGAVNVGRSEGQLSVQPQEPAPQRTLGGVWEMPIWAVQVPGYNGALSLADRRRFHGPGTVYVPWNRYNTSLSMPPGNFTVDMDVNASGGIQEGFRGKTTDMVTRTLGPRNKYTPDLFTVTNKPPDANRVGYWRYIAPGTVQFSVEIRNTTTTAVKSTTGIGFWLPTSASLTQRFVLSGIIDNPESRDSVPNYVDVTCRTSLGNNQCYLYSPNLASLKDGLDAVNVIPGKSSLIVSGVYETDDFEGRSVNG